MAVRILHNQSNALYHADLALGSTYIKDWHLRSPRHAEHGVKTINRYTADEGTAAHFEFSNDGDLVIMAGETRLGVRAPHLSSGAGMMCFTITSPLTLNISFIKGAISVVFAS